MLAVAILDNESREVAGNRDWFTRHFPVIFENACRGQELALEKPEGLKAQIVTFSADILADTSALR